LGLGAAIYVAITLKDGKIEQTNFDGYRVLRIDEMPKVEVHIVQSPEAPTGGRAGRRSDRRVCPAREGETAAVRKPSCRRGHLVVL